jgi:Ca2+-binding RTX toxin-like protein
MPAHRQPSLALALALLASLVAVSSAGAAPSCAEGPETVGETIVGTPCGDTIRPPRAVTTVFGEGGDDTLYGGRGNDRLDGGEGADRLYGGIGDDRLRGGPGADLVAGGFGADSLDGEAGGDYVRGDATIDAIGDSGGDGADSLSYATGATPGFPNEGPLFDEYAGFPQSAEGRGVYIDLEQGFANNGLAPAGGGVDLELEGTNFEVVVGTPFADFIVGSDDAETLFGGGGPDVLIGGGGADTIHGGAEGDSCQGAVATSGCETSGKQVVPRNPAGFAAGETYLTGSDSADAIVASYSPGPPASVAFSVDGNPAGSFAFPRPPDSILLAGLEGEDSLAATDFPASTSVILLGGEGDDELTGGATEDALVDGPGDDSAAAGGGDDALPNNGGGDDLDAGPGEDLFVSNAVCDGDMLDGGGDRDNANWANFDAPVAIDLGAGIAGLVGAGGQAQCGGGLPTTLAAIEDIEGSSLDDTLVGDPGSNQLLGRPGHDSYSAAAGDDSILANSGDEDLAIDCGEGFDTAQVDRPQYGDPVPLGCESVEERDPNSFRPPDTPPDPSPEPPPGGAPSPSPSPSPGEQPTPRPVEDRTAPRTRIAHRPPARILTSARHHRVVFAFLADEPGARFRCKLDRGRFRPCVSPRAYWVLPGRHALRIFALDRAGNRDPTPALFRFAVRRVSAHWSQSHRRRGPSR